MDEDTILGFMVLLTIAIAIGYTCFKLGYYKAVKEMTGAI